MTWRNNSRASPSANSPKCPIQLDCYLSIGAITNSVRSFIFDPNAPTCVTTDASDVGLGAVLSQTQQGREPSLNAICESAVHDPTHDHVVGALQTDHLSLLDVKSAIKRDSTLATVRHFVFSGWPSKRTLASDIQQFFAAQGELQTEDQCLLQENRIVLPTTLQRRLLAKAHEGHPDIARMKRKLRQSYWWPGQDKDIENFVKHCAGCQLSDKSLAPDNLDSPAGITMAESCDRYDKTIPNCSAIVKIPVYFASAHRAQPPSPQLATSASDAQGLHSRAPYRVGDRVFARRPQVLKGQSPWSNPPIVLKVLGSWTYRLSDGQTWNARKLRRYLEPEAPLLHHHEIAGPLVRRSQRQNRGVSPARYPAEL
ncbi:Zf-h2c2 and rve domain containing protein [Plakobranchus ocellatus]|uniref:Zf-h2c2 and rve domain containing protein n=1 Tax=Plakobranchus ocellatus TaxID=259542 RepID=A0AAV4CUZ7_9GAST|nr:Zf-h2c2 and rve domain containing protein [Plakobranchus ocellatus]